MRVSLISEYPHKTMGWRISAKKFRFSRVSEASPFSAGLLIPLRPAVTAGGGVSVRERPKSRGARNQRDKPFRRIVAFMNNPS